MQHKGASQTFAAFAPQFRQVDHFTGDYASPS